MKSSEYGRISDELLSAYIDNAITEKERNLVEAAVAADAEVAWRLDTLQQTVRMLHALPELALPRSFTIQESHLLSEGPRNAPAESQEGGASWIGRMAHGWRDFWQAGAPVYRNLAAASLVLLLVLVGSDVFLSAGMATPATMTAPAAEFAAGELSPAAQQSQEMTPDEAEDAPVASAQLAAKEVPAEEPAAAQPEDAAPAVDAAPSQDATLALATEPLTAQDSAAALDSNAQPVPQPQVAAASMAESSTDAPTEGEAFSAESVAAAPPEGAAAGLFVPPEARLALPSSELARTESGGLGSAGGAPQAQMFDEQADSAFAAEGENVVLSEAKALTSTDVVAAAAISPLHESADGQARMSQNGTDSESATDQPQAMEEQPQAMLLTEPDAATADQESPESTTTEATPELAKVEESAAVAALPTAQPLPTASAEVQPAAPVSTGANLPLQPVTLGLLAATLIFGGLWWRSRGAA